MDRNLEALEIHGSVLATPISALYILLPPTSMASKLPETSLRRDQMDLQYKTGSSLYLLLTILLIIYSVLQDLACKKCSTVVGLRCDDAPDGHLLKKYEPITRSSNGH